MPRFSVIIPYFRAGSTIRRTLASILAQTYAGSEVILIDDGSNDDIANVVAEHGPLFAAAGGVLVFASNAGNKGPSVARNLGWDKATGDYVAFLDSDDEWHPQKLQICAHYLEGQAAPGIVHGTSVAPDADTARRFAHEARQVGDFTRRELPGFQWLIKNQAATPSIVIRSAVTERFDPTLRYCEDHDLWLRIACRHGPFLQLAGPPLTQLGRQTMSAGGQSSRIYEMRIGEMRMYANFCGKRPLLFPLLPLLWGWSVMKHCYFILRRNLAAF